MKAEVVEAMRTLFPGESDAKLAVRQLAARTQAHRLRKFGFEPQINHYNAAELKLLAMHMNEPRRSVLLKEAESRGN